MNWKVFVIMLNQKKSSVFFASSINYYDIVFALKCAEFKSYFQPKIELSSLEVSGLEVLARWKLPNSQLLTPDIFLPAVKSAGLLNELTHTLTDQALTTYNALKRSGLDVPLALNLDASQIGDSSFIGALITQVNRNPIHNQPLTLEITESGGEALTASHFIKNLARLDACGWRLSIDDFGTAYSALERVCQIPCSEIKIDRTFTQNMLADIRYKKIAKYIIAIGKAMQLTVVAEGIETLEQLNFLQGLGCDQGQGFLFSAALPAEDIERWCLRWNGAL
ncbi:EAL domain-containing protein [Pseudomonas savastanoi pv. phaseolicola]|uniref:EAL domain protein n=3 Tax=Pseudomonas savastanoi TaxID=29438 RepID=A0A3M3GQ20_PSESG|nr:MULTISPECIES: EAL domain-containing protein [Pseudomonas]KPY12821.1 EAL domain protein [Pseudomonas savastanoi pv. phaseolicola]MDG6382301.1 EAL domain-containing protein [Pseudomonas savastanoi pv. phaseolicola]MDG6392685.1 EAL domain-containing protein [Pseudomonas savastanoi pv. phaseolicola]RMM61606.1 hypothetical protein ALQ74_200109 [Pseudomonas savastanoi pv. glycinea]RMM75614.1 EAL domain protein [Pseudomonas savastanoi pv. glycinea]